MSQSPLAEAPPILEVGELRKSFGGVRAVDGVSFTVRAGELFGFLGPNGAGKTTTINILTGLARPDAGRIRIAGIDCSRSPKAAQHLMGVVADESNLYPELSGFDNLCFCASLYGMPRKAREAAARESLRRFGLEESAQRKVAGYSRGMKRKLTIAAGIIHNPRILFLDEPTTGIDVAAARQIRRIIADAQRDGTTVFLTTHYIEEAERLCGRIAFIVAGRIVRIDAIDALMREAQDRHIVEFAVSGGAAGLCAAIRAEFPSLECQAAVDDAVRVTSFTPVRIGPLVKLIEERGSEVVEARKIRQSLEEVFVEVTGIEAAAMKKEIERKGSRG